MSPAKGATPGSWDVWLEGFAATGERGTAQYLGRHRGETFQRACQAAVRHAGWPRHDYDPIRNTYWGVPVLRHRAARRVFG